MITRQLTNDGSYTLFSDTYNQTYHSIHGSKTEAEYVFLKNAGVQRRLRQKKDTHILEIGFGTGLNFLLTADLATKHGVRLSYWAYEKYLLQGDTIASLAFETLLEHAALLEQLILWRSAQPAYPPNGLLCCVFNDSLALHLILGDATESQLPDDVIHAIYLDAFSPDKNPELWTAPFFQKLYTCLDTGGKLATYSAKSQVRKNLITAGFEATKVPGPPGKREILVAQKL